MGIMVTDFIGTFSIGNCRNIPKGYAIPQNSPVANIQVLRIYPYASALIRAYAHTPLPTPVHALLRLHLSQQHKYSGYFNICSCSQKKYVVLERNLRLRESCEERIFASTIKWNIIPLLPILGLHQSIFEETAFGSPVPNSVLKSCGIVRKIVGISSAYPYSLILRTTKNELASFSVEPSFLHEIRFFGIIAAYHCKCALALMTFIDNNTVRRFQRCKQPSDLRTTNSEVFNHLNLRYVSAGFRTSTLILFTQHKLVIANISDNVAEKMPLQFVHEFSKGIVLLIIFDYYITSVWHSNSTHLKILGLRRNCKQTSTFGDFKERRFKCLVKNTSSFCFSDTEKLANSFNGRITKPTTDVIHFNGNKESITIPRTTSVEMFLNRTDYYIIRPILRIYDYSSVYHYYNYMGIKNPRISKGAF